MDSFKKSDDRQKAITTKTISAIMYEMTDRGGSEERDLIDKLKERESDWSYEPTFGGEYSSTSSCRVTVELFDECATGCVDYKLGCSDKDENYARCVDMEFCKEAGSTFTHIVIAMSCCFILFCIFKLCLMRYRAASEEE